MTAPHTVELLPGEAIIIESTNRALMLTNLRVKFEGSRGGDKSYKSIPINRIAGCAAVTQSYPVLLLLATLALLSMFGFTSNSSRYAAAAIAVCLVVGYFTTRNGHLEIYSMGELTIKTPTTGMKHEDVRRFAEAVAHEVGRR